MRIEYTQKITSAATTYVEIDSDEKQALLKHLRLGFFGVLETSLQNVDVLEVINSPHVAWLKSSKKKHGKKQLNSLVSFMSGVLAQHETTNKDFSLPQLEAIETATEMFSALLDDYQTVSFSEKTKLFEWPERR